MKQIRKIFFLTALLAFHFPMVPASANNCNSAAQALASQSGGEVLSVSAGNQNGQTVCDVTIRIPGKNGQPPRVVTKSITL